MSYSKSSSTSIFGNTTVSHSSGNWSTSVSQSPTAQSYHHTATSPFATNAEKTSAAQMYVGLTGMNPTDGEHYKNSLG